MTKTFTPDDLLRYLYEDTTTEEKQEIERALQNDSCLRREFEQLRADMELLDELTMAPSDDCINRVMDYAGAMNMKALVN